jgi:hypothetical protein
VAASTGDAAQHRHDAVDRHADTRLRGAVTVAHAPSTKLGEGQGLAHQPPAGIGEPSAVAALDLDPALDRESQDAAKA